MTTPLRARLATIISRTLFALPLDMTAAEVSLALAETLLGSEEWAAREAVVEAAFVWRRREHDHAGIVLGNRPDKDVAAVNARDIEERARHDLRNRIDSLRTALVRLVAGRGETR